MQAWNDSLEEARVLKLEAMARQMTSSFEEKELEIEKEFEKEKVRRQCCRAPH